MSKLKPETIEKLEWLKGRLRKYPHKYNQFEWCGTQACLAGFCLPKALHSRKILFKYGDTELDGLGSYSAIAEDWLGLDTEQGRILFKANWVGNAAQFNRKYSNTPNQAVEKACERIDLFIQSGGTK